MLLTTSGSMSSRSSCSSGLGYHTAAALSSNQENNSTFPSFLIRSPSSRGWCTVEPCRAPCKGAMECYEGFFCCSLFLVSIPAALAMDHDGPMSQTRFKMRQ